MLIKLEIEQELSCLKLQQARTKLTAASLLLTLTLYQERHSQSVSHHNPDPQTHLVTARVSEPHFCVNPNIFEDSHG